MSFGGDQGRYVVPAQAVEQLLQTAIDSSQRVDMTDFARRWRSGRITDVPQTASGVAIDSLLTKPGDRPQQYGGQVASAPECQGGGAA
jgi:hypothetical protein